MAFPGLPAFRLLAALAVAGLVLPAQPSARPAAVASDSIARLRLLVGTAAPFVDIVLDDGTVLHGRTQITTGEGAARVDPQSGSCRVENAQPGTPVEAECVVAVAGLGERAAMRWHLHLPPGGSATAEIFNANRAGSPTLVDRVESHAAGTRAMTPAADLLAGAVTPASGAQPLVVAAYYPWYIHQTWESQKLLDHPLVRYSTEQVDELAPVFREAQAAGIDALAVSWSGRDHRVSVAFQTAEATGMKLAILAETLTATANHHTKTVDPTVIGDWLEEIVDVYGSRPTYLRVGERPVVFVYAAGSLSVAQWVDVVNRVRGSGRNPILIADSYDPAYLQAFDGEFNYSVVGLPADQLDGFDRRTILASRAFSLLNGGATRIAVATVSPGYDDTKLHDRPTHLVVDRAGGAVYERQWRAAIAAEPDWVFVTSWNEWYENTEIEPSVLYGDAYLRATGKWTREFVCAPPPGSGNDEAPPRNRKRCG